MDQEEIYSEDSQPIDGEYVQEYEPVTVAPPLEGAFSKYMREYRLLNSLLVSLLFLTIIMASIWGMMMGLALSGEGNSDFSDGGTAPAAQKQEKQKVVKLMQRQKKAQPTTQQTFRTTAISDITLPDFNELDVKDLAPVVEAAAPTMSAAGMNNDQMKKAMAGIGLALPKTMQQRCDPQKRIARLKSGGGKTMTEAAIVKGLKWLQTMQDPDGSWGGKDKDADGNPKSTDKNAMTGMALLCYLGHCELQDSPDYGPTVQKAINFITSTTPEPKINGGPGSYSHPIRTYALCEAYTMTKIKKLEEYARRATIHIIKGQNENGGWAYGYGKGVAAHTDLSVTGWNIQALKAAVYTGISIDGIDEALDKAIKYTKECQDKAGKFAYQRGKSGKASLTGTGVLSLQIWKNAKSEEAERGLQWIVQNEAVKTEWSKIDVYGWYYNAQACFQATGVSGGSKYWKAWNKDFQQTVCSNQAPDGHWPHGNHFHGDTDIYRTTMAILMLEVYYRYMPTGNV
jgi:prenyltransferase beta subunit